jgi:hypothetical protein
VVKETILAATDVGNAGAAIAGAAAGQCHALVIGNISGNEQVRSSLDVGRMMQEIIIDRQLGMVRRIAI